MFNTLKLTLAGVAVTATLLSAGLSHAAPIVTKTTLGDGSQVRFAWTTKTTGPGEGAYMTDGKARVTVSKLAAAYGKPATINLYSSVAAQEVFTQGSKSIQAPASVSTTPANGVVTLKRAANGSYSGTFEAFLVRQSQYPTGVKMTAHEVAVYTDSHASQAPGQNAKMPTINGSDGLVPANAQ